MNEFYFIALSSVKGIKIPSFHYSTTIKPNTNARRNRILKKEKENCANLLTSSFFITGVFLQRGKNNKITNLMPFELVDESFVGDIYDKRLTINLPSFPFFSVSCETCCDWAIFDQNEITSLYDVISKWTVTPVNVFLLLISPNLFHPHVSVNVLASIISIAAIENGHYYYFF